MPVNLDLNIEVSKDFNNALINFTLSQAVNETLIVNNNAYKTVNGTYLLNLTAMDYGNHEINATLLSDFYISKNSTSIFCDVKKTYFEISNFTTIYNSNDEFAIQLFDELGESLSDYPIRYSYKNITYEAKTNSNGKVIIDFKLPVGNYTFDIVYLGDETHINASNSSKIIINPSKTTINISDIAYDSFDLFNITFNVTDEIGNALNIGEIDFKINNISYNLNNTFMIKVPLKADLNNLSVAFRCDNYCPSNYTTTFNVTPVNLDLNINVYLDFNNASILFNLSQAINETLIINQNITLKSVDGIVKYNMLNLDYGNYTIDAKLSSDFYKAFNKTEFLCNVKKTFIEINDFKTIYNSGENLKIKLKDEFNQPMSGFEIKTSLDNKTFISDDEGVVLMPVSLKSSKDIVVYFKGSEFYHKSQNTSRITIASSINLLNITTYTLNSHYTAYLLNKTGNPLNNTKITFIINNIEYHVISDDDGKATLPIPLKYGNVIVSVLNPDTGEALSQNIRVLKRISENKDISLYYGASYNYKIRILNDYGGYSDNINVTLTVNGKTYIKTTDAYGYAYLNIKNLKVGKYSITSEYLGYKTTNIIIIKSTLTAKNIIVKKGKTIKFKAKLVNSKGKVLKGKKITFKFKGKTYKSKTNKKGIAIVKIKNKYRNGKYKIYTSYLKLKITNTIKIKK